MGFRPASAGSRIESAKRCGVEPRAPLSDATLRVVRHPGAVALASDPKSRKSPDCRVY